MLLCCQILAITSMSTVLWPNYGNEDLIDPFTPCVKMRLRCPHWDPIALSSSNNQTSHPPISVHLHLCSMWSQRIPDHLWKVVRPIGSQSFLNACWLHLHLYFLMVRHYPIAIRSPKTHFNVMIQRRSFIFFQPNQLWTKIIVLTVFFFLIFAWMAGPAWCSGPHYAAAELRGIPGMTQWRLCLAVQLSTPPSSLSSVILLILAWE